jgi:hypothetical protein
LGPVRKSQTVLPVYEYPDSVTISPIEASVCAAATAAREKDRNTISTIDLQVVVRLIFDMLSSHISIRFPHRPGAAGINPGIRNFSGSMI